MSIVIASGFYIYYLIAVNFYRKELHFRFIAYNKMTGIDKAPISIKKSVLCSVIIIAVQIALCCLFGKNSLVLINAIPVIILTIHLRILRKRIVVADINNQEE